MVRTIIIIIYMNKNNVLLQMVCLLRAIDYLGMANPVHWHGYIFCRADSHVFTRGGGNDMEVAVG